MLTRIALTLCFIALLPLTAHAKVEINDEGASRLKAIFSDYLDTQKTALAAQGGELITEGELLIEQADSYYAITMPSVTIGMGEGAKIKLGLIAVNAIPTDKEHEWKMSLSIPTPLMFHSKKGELFRFNIGEQKAGGVYNEKLNSYSSFASIYKNMNLESASGEELMTLDKIIAKTQYAPDENDKWSGDAKFNFSGLSIKDAKDVSSINIGSISALAELGGFDPVVYKSAQEKVLSQLEDMNKEMDALRKAMKDGTELDQSKIKGLEEKSEKMMTSTLDLMLKAMNKSTLTLSVKDFGIEGVDKKTGKNNALSLGNILFNAGIDGLKDDKADIIYALSFDGLNIDPIPANSELMPSKFKTQLKLNHLPINQLIDMGKNAMAAKAENPDAGGMIAMRSLMSLPQILANAGTTLTLTDSYLANDTYNAKIDGEVKASTTSMIGAVGDMTLDVSNLSKIISLINTQMSQETDQSKVGKAQALLSQLQLLQQIGRVEGNSTVAKFELNEQGQTLVNGQDLKEAMSGSVEPAAAAQ